MALLSSAEVWGRIMSTKNLQGEGPSRQHPGSRSTSLQKPLYDVGAEPLSGILLEVEPDAAEPSHVRGRFDFQNGDKWARCDL